MTWNDDLAAWWMDEVADDPAYAEQVIPLAVSLIEPSPGQRWLDLGCGEGQVMRALSGSGASVLGCDLSVSLAAKASSGGNTVVARLPDLAWMIDASLDGAYAVLVIEHLDEIADFFSECHRVVKPGGDLVAVLNHPVMTAEGSTPIVDQEDGEILWRWGDYFGDGSTSEPAAGGEVVFHHRSLSTLLNGASQAGWSLERMVEASVGDGQAARDPLLAMQRSIPRLLGVRWKRLG